MAAKMGVLGLIMSFYPYLRSAMVRFPLIEKNLSSICFLKAISTMRQCKIKDIMFSQLRKKIIALG